MRVRDVGATKPRAPSADLLVPAIRQGRSLRVGAAFCHCGYDRKPEREAERRHRPLF
ncbi:MAG: hypothetical protein U0231_03585 [Nitrospiraceae bacterium]